MPRPALPATVAAPIRAPTSPVVAPSDGELAVSEAVGPDMDDVEGDSAEHVESAEDEEDGEGEDTGAESEKPAFDPTDLKEIGNLASWTVSTSKPGCGVEALRDEDPNLFWQSDGPQPHLLNIHFTRLVAISHIRLYLDFSLDESYTPTKLAFLAGTAHHDLQEFVELAFEQPRGWIDIDLSGVGGRQPRRSSPSSLTSSASSASDDRDDEEDEENTQPVLRAHLVQMRIAENHQNGKDTHVRGLQIFARNDAVSTRAPAARRRQTHHHHHHQHQHQHQHQQRQRQRQTPEGDVQAHAAGNVGERAEDRNGNAVLEGGLGQGAEWMGDVVLR
ncbi:MAG: anaphase promoting complex subunit doc1 [Thelocarpon impressellum]|nr:MAG: anaphase promoting complex subunit doc1 [Thelocarpon impressellum]